MHCIHRTFVPTPSALTLFALTSFVPLIPLVPIIFQVRSHFHLPDRPVYFLQFDGDKVYLAEYPGREEIRGRVESVSYTHLLRMQNFMMVWSRNQDMKSGETCSFLAKEKIV